MDKIEELREKYEEIAKQRGLILNPNKEKVSKLLKALLKIEEKEGKKYCPCKSSRTDNEVCPCVDSADEIKNTGHCYCQLFFTP